MQVNTMRKVDFFVGVPLCFLCTIIFKIFHFRKIEKKTNPNKILFIELSEMGSAILVDPAMRKARMKYNAQLFFLTFKKNKSCLELLNTISQENIFTIDESSFLKFFISSVKFFFWCRKKKIDTVFDLELFSRFTALLTGVSGAKNLVGFHNFYNEGLYRGNFLTHKVLYNPHMHISKNFFSMIMALEQNDLPYSKIFISDDELKITKAKIDIEDQESVLNIIKKNVPSYDANFHKIVLINSNASDLLPERRWDPDNYIKLIKKILDNSNRAFVLLTGSLSEKDGIPHQIKRHIDDERCFNFAGMIKFKQLTSLYSLSEFMLTNDSGPAHFASVTDMPVFVIFGPETPKLYAPLSEKTTPIYANLACSPCVSAYNHRRTPCKNNLCIQTLTCQIVYDVIKECVEKIDNY